MGCAVQQQQQPVLNGLPTDVAGVVLLQLASCTQERLRTCRGLSKACRALVDSQVTRLHANLAALAAQRPGSNGLPLHLPRLRHLSFERPPAADCGELLVQLAAAQPHLLAQLTALDLSACQGLEPDVLATVLAACGRLTSLSLPSLSAFVASGRTAFAPFLQAVRTHAPQLQELHGAGDYVDESASSLAVLTQLTGLQVLDLTPGSHTIRLPPPALASLAALRRLRSLSLGNHLALPHTCDVAASLPALTSLAFTYTGEHPGSVQAFAALRRSSTLRRLALAGVPCGDKLLALLGGLPALSELRLHACRFSGSAAGAGALRGKLASLQLETNDSDAAALAAALPALGAGLTSLAIRVHKSAQDVSGLMQAILRLPRLEHLQLGSFYRPITEAELAGLPLQPQLTSLALSNHWSDATLARLLACTPGLHELHLTSCAEVGDAGLSGVLGSCSGLRSVRLVLMRGVTAAGVAGLAGGPVLSRVVCEGCRNVSAQECSSLMQQLDRPGLEIVKAR